LVQRVVGQNGVTEMGEFEMASPAWVFWFQHVKRKASFPTVYVQNGWESKYQVSPGSTGMEKQLEVIWVL